jgi:hypothetical protein
MDTLVGVVAFGCLGIVSVLTGGMYSVLVRLKKLEETIADLKRELEEMKRKTGGEQR